MPLSTVPSTSTQFDEKRSENMRMFLVGVKTYDHLQVPPVASAHNNVVSWVIQGLRMGFFPGGNHVHINTDPEEFQLIADDVVLRSDLPETVRAIAKFKISVDEAGPKLMTKRIFKPTIKPCSDPLRLSKPRFSTILRDLVIHADDLLQTRDLRLMLVFSGHGALSQGHFVLCPQDTLKADTTPNTSSAERQEKLKRDKSDEQKAALDDLFELARKKGASAELLDILESTGLFFQVDLQLDLAQIKKNLRKLPKQTRQPPSFLNVITPVHLKIILGDTSRRVTLVLDACGSGGDATPLQGSESAHDWASFGLNCRILAATPKTQKAAEATMGERRYSAATWALTRVLSRWSPVADGPAYAMDITNGNLVLRASMLLDALSFNQQITLSGPLAGRRRAADMPFFGLHPSTETRVDPSADAGGIQLDSNTPMIWEFTIGGVLKAALFVSTGNPANHQLYVLGTSSSASDLAGNACTVTLRTSSATSTAAAIDEINQRYPGSNFTQRAVTDAAPATEPDYSGPATPPGFVYWQNPAGSSSTRKVWLKWLAATGTSPAKLIFVLDTNTAYAPADFAPVGTAMTFNTGATNFGTGWKAQEIALSA